MEKKCEKEVIGLHTFFAQWFRSDVENNDDVFLRVENALDKQFILIAPTGELQSREKILQQIKAGYGSRKDDKKEYRLWVQNIQCRLTEGNLCLVTYEEWAEVNGITTARLSSALFRNNEKAVNGVEWVHVHEVYIPSE